MESLLTWSPEMRLSKRSKVKAGLLRNLSFCQVFFFSSKRSFKVLGGFEAGLFNKSSKPAIWEVG